MESSDRIVTHKCPVCHAEYQGETWKKKCYDCYRNFRYSKRIYSFGRKSNLYMSHPSVTKEEMDEWIKKQGYDAGWGAEEFNPAIWTKVKIWIDNTNFD